MYDNNMIIPDKHHFNQSNQYKTLQSSVNELVKRTLALHNLINVSPVEITTVGLKYSQTK